MTKILNDLNHSNANNLQSKVYATVFNEQKNSDYSLYEAFGLMAEYMLNRGGYFCGTFFDDDFRGVKQEIISKDNKPDKLLFADYVQSQDDTFYKEIKKLLDEDNEVLFAGTPCQCAALKNILNAPYEKLILADTICGGALPSSLYQCIVNEKCGEKQINDVYLKYDGSADGSVNIHIKYGEEEEHCEKLSTRTFGQASIKNLCSAECCEACQFAQIPRQGDITVGGLAGVSEYNKPSDDYLNYIVLLENTERGKAFLSELKENNVFKIAEEVSFFDAFARINSPVCHFPQAHPGKSDFCELINSDHNFEEAWSKAKDKKYDVLILGIWYGGNYGSILTNFALYTFLKELGYKCAFVDMPNILWPSSRIHRNPLFISRKFCNKYFDLTPKYADCMDLEKLNALCDTFIVGSDQLWNYKTFKSAETFFFLDFVKPEKRKISYATSFGQTTFQGTENEKIKAGKYLDEFLAISVREDSGVDLCKKEFGLDAVKVLDPVFMCNREYYFECASRSELTKDNSQKPYLLAYILDPNEEKQSALEYAAEKTGLELICIPNANVKKVMRENWRLPIKEDLPVEDWLFYFKNADMVITDSFHGTCFSIIFERRFISILNRGRGKDRFYSLLNEFSLMEHLVETPSVILENDSLFNLETDYEKINTLIEEKRESSLKWLKNSLIKTKPEFQSMVYSDSYIKAFQSNPDFIKIRILATLLHDYGIKYIVLSPGGRDVPLVRMFEYNEEKFVLHRVTDERSAAYFGLGLAAQLRQPVACVCTSGTAASNYLPAVTEAYYTGVPLIVITADRQQVYLEQGEDQTIPQRHIYDGVIKKSVTIPEGSGYKAEYQTRRDISDCILESTHNGYGPVHINIAIEDIRIGSKAPKIYWKILPHINPHILRVGVCDGEEVIGRWVESLKKSPKILVIYGQNPLPDTKQLQDIEAFASKYNCVIVTDFISNLDCAYSLKPYNMLQAISSDEFNRYLTPDILISVGGKSLMNDPLMYKIRNGSKKIRHWSVIPSGKIKDTYFRLTSVLEMSQNYFFEYFAGHAGDIRNNGVYFGEWKRLTESYDAPKVTKFNAHYIQSQFIPNVPENSILHLGVGQSFYDCRRYKMKKNIDVFCNMGTNGIDGCTSTFMGQCSVVKDKLCFLLVGDLSFFYDMNSIWNKTPNKNVRILMVNNNGTGLLRGHKLKAVSSVHNTSAQGWVESTKFKYMSASSMEEYDEKLRYFISKESDQALFFEVFCD